MPHISQESDSVDSFDIFALIQVKLMIPMKVVGAKYAFLAATRVISKNVVRYHNETE